MTQDQDILRASFINAFHNYDEHWKKKYAELKVTIAPVESAEQEYMLNYLLNIIVSSDEDMEYIFNLPNNIPVLKEVLYKYYENKNGTENAFAGKIKKYNNEYKDGAIESFKKDGYARSFIDKQADKFIKNHEISKVKQFKNIINSYFRNIYFYSEQQEMLMSLQEIKIKIEI